METMLIFILILIVILCIALAYYLGKSLERSKWKEMIRKGIINKPPLKQIRNKKEVMCERGCGRIACGEFDGKMLCNYCWD